MTAALAPSPRSRLFALPPGGPGLPEERPARGEDSSAARQGKAPVMVVEDSPDDVYLLKEAFHECGFKREIEAFEDAEAAIRRLEDGGRLPALVLLDLQLPRRSGFQVLAWIRSRPAPVRSLKVVVLTTSGDQAELKRAYDLGADLFLTKPGDFLELCRMVEDISRRWLG